MPVCLTGINIVYKQTEKKEMHDNKYKVSRQRIYFGLRTTKRLVKSINKEKVVVIAPKPFDFPLNALLSFGG